MKINSIGIKQNNNFYTKDGKIDKDELLYCLNSVEDNPIKDNNIMKKIDKYFVDNK